MMIQRMRSRTNTVLLLLLWASLLTKSANSLLLLRPASSSLYKRSSKQRPLPLGRRQATLIPRMMATFAAPPLPPPTRTLLQHPDDKSSSSPLRKTTTQTTLLLPKRKMTTSSPPPLPAPPPKAAPPSAAQPLQSEESKKRKILRAQASTYDFNLFLGLILPPILAFGLQTDIAQMVAFCIDIMGFNGITVDGNLFATNLIRPTINGVVVPATSIGLGTLFATTVNVLWNRQLQMRSIINMEVGELRLLRRALLGCFGTAQHVKRRMMAMELLHGYTTTLVAETMHDTLMENDNNDGSGSNNDENNSSNEELYDKNGVILERLKDIQRNGGISMNELDELAEMLHGVDGAAASRQSSVATCESLLVSLNAHRSNRVATTLSVFPKIHWAVIIVLYLGIIAAFLIDSNQEVLQYLNSIELRILFAIMIGGGSGAAMLVKDLQDPFEGSFCITREARQLESFLQVLEADMHETARQTQQVPGQVALISLDREKRRVQYYDTKNTLYFHLLTGPVAGQVKLFGDLFTWVIGKVSMQYQFIKKSFMLLRRSSFLPKTKRTKLQYFSNKNNEKSAMIQQN